MYISLSNGGHCEVQTEIISRRPISKTSNCNKLLSTYPFVFVVLYFHLWLLIHNNRLKHREAKNKINPKRTTHSNRKWWTMAHAHTFCRGVRQNKLSDCGVIGSSPVTSRSRIREKFLGITSSLPRSPAPQETKWRQILLTFRIKGLKLLVLCIPTL